MEGSSLIQNRRLHGHAGYALFDILMELVAAACRGIADRLKAFAIEQDRAKARRELWSLDDRVLKDIGIERNDIDSLFR
jgi:uncharacterized protein YjiS (DUF1127 family)